MSECREPEPGEEWVREHTSFTVLDVSDGVVTMRHHAYKNDVEETLSRFREEVAAGRAVVHRTCSYCELPVDPEMGWEEDLHYRCWFQNASVRERCEAEVDRPSGNRLAFEALQSDDPREHLLGVIGDPARTFHDRIDAEELLSHAVPSKTIIEAFIRCPNCREGEAFEMNPMTGAVHCHCGTELKSAD